MNWIKQNWFKLSLLMVIVFFGYLLLQNSPHGKGFAKYSPVEYKELNKECKKFGEENYGDTITYQSEGNYINRYFEFSIPFKSCFMKEDYYTATDDIGTGLKLSTIVDIYLDKKIISFNKECLKNINYGEGMTNKQINDKCTAYSDIIKNGTEIWKK